MGKPVQYKCIRCGAVMPVAHFRKIAFQHGGLRFRVDASCECDACARGAAVARYEEHRDLVHVEGDRVVVDWNLYRRERETWRGCVDECDRLLEDVGVLCARGPGAYDVVGCGVSLCPGWGRAFATEEHARGYMAAVLAGAMYRLEVIGICK